jgi:hypothetical protein
MMLVDLETAATTPWMAFQAPSLDKIAIQGKRSLAMDFVNNNSIL